MSANAITPSWGFIGKIPAKGDFIKQDLPKPFADLFHDWQQAIIAVSKEQLQETWQSHFLNAPIWHFALDSGVTNDATIIGTMIPSVDAAGRYFFFTLARPVLGDAVSYWSCRDWANESQDLALTVLDDHFTFDVWSQNLQSGTELINAISAETLPVSQKKLSGENLFIKEHTETNVMSLLSHVVRQQFPKPCYWWTDGNDAIEPMMLVMDGLPQTGKFAAMLDGQWQKWNW
ncbi:TPA: type VI secretion system-associated protein TagF [Vibrio vulnificus]